MFSGPRWRQRARGPWRPIVFAVTLPAVLLAPTGLGAQVPGESTGPVNATGVTAPVDDASLEHPVVKPMSGARLGPESRVDAVGQLAVRYRTLDGRSVRETVRGQFWHLEYQLEERTTSRAEILANYAAEAERTGGEVLTQTATRMLFRLARGDRGLSWVSVNTGSRGRYALEIVDEAGLDLEAELDADVMRATLHQEGHLPVYGLSFDLDGVGLRPGSGAVLDTIAAMLQADPTLRLEIQGHTDSTGETRRNRQLSLERARAVAEALALYGIDRTRLVARGYGAELPVGDNETAEGRSRNQRVELVRIP